MTNQTNAGSASSVAVTAGEGDMDFMGDVDLSFSQRKEVFR